MSDHSVKVEVAYALPDRQALLSVSVAPGTTVYEAACQSGITDRFPELDLANSAMGVFGKVEPKPKERAVQEGDRIEIYRPLIADPKEVRKRRALEKAKREQDASA